MGLATLWLSRRLRLQSLALLIFVALEIQSILQTFCCMVPGRLGLVFHDRAIQIILQTFWDSPGLFRPSRPYFVGFKGGDLLELVGEGGTDFIVLVSAKICVI